MNTSSLDEQSDWCQCSNCRAERENTVCGDPDCWCAEGSVNSVSGEKKMDTSAVGTRFFTGNEVINSLPAGTILEVTHVDGNGQAEVEVLDVIDPAEIGPVDPTPVAPVTFSAGDRINTKYGAATVVDVSSRLDVQRADGEDFTNESTHVLYVADDFPRLRIANVNKVSLLKQ